MIAVSALALMASLPGYFHPVKAFAKLRAGATALKLFPAETASAAVLRAQRAVLPRDMPVLAVGGVVPDTMAPSHAAGADDFGLGWALYKLRASAERGAEAVRTGVAAWDV